MIKTKRNIKLVGRCRIVLGEYCFENMGKRGEGKVSLKGAVVPKKNNI